MTWDAAERRTVAAGGSVSYTIVVRNTGNVADTLTFSGTPSDWSFSFSPASMTLDFGTPAPSAVLRVTIRTPSGALVEHGAVQILATSSTDSTTVGRVTVEIDIARVRGVTASLDTSAAVFDRNRLDYVVVVRNTGNARETVTVAVTNPSELAAVGWSVQLGNVSGPFTGPVVRDVTVEANQTARVALRAESRGGGSGAQALVQATAQDSEAVTTRIVVTLQMPALAPGPATVMGPEISRTAPLDTLFLAVVFGVASAVVLGVLLSRRRR